MKSNLLISVFAVLMIAQSAHAQSCADNLVAAKFSAVQAAALCTNLQSDYTGNSDVSGTLTVAGLSTLTGQIALGSETVAGAGTTVANAAQLSGTVGVHRLTGANGTVGWKFATTTPVGSVQILLNTTAGVAKIYGETGSTVNAGAVDASFDALTGIKPIICVKTAALTYLCS